MPIALDTEAIAAARLELAGIESFLADAVTADERAALASRRVEVLRRLRTLRDPREAVDRPEDLVGLLDGNLPVVLLPVRLETRFADNGDTLRIRIFPDDIGVHTHEPEVTDREHEDAVRYWTRRIAAPAGDTGDTERLGAWRDLAAAHGAGRAGWLVDVLRPTNVDDIDGGSGQAPAFPDVAHRASPWTRPPRAMAMPERWVAIGLRGGRERFRTWGSTVAEGLAFGPSPDPRFEPDVPTAAEVDPLQDDLDIDDEMRWMIDYDEAVRVGMAITVTASDLGPRDRLSEGLDRLIVLGVDWSRDAEESERVLRDLLVAHRHTEGLGLVAPGTPTNATAGAAPAGLDDASAVDARDPAAHHPPPSPTSDAGRLAVALGLADPTPLARIDGADRDDRGGTFHMHQALWAVTLGYFFEQLLDGVASSAQLDAVRDHFSRFVRGAGPLGTLRVGDQPYGVLPVVAPQAWRPTADERLLAGMAQLLGSGRGLWTHAAERSPHLGRTDDGEQDLLDVLQQAPTMQTLRFRTVFGPLLTANTSGLAAASRFQQLSGQWLAGLMGDRTIRSRLLTTTLHPGARRLSVPLVQADSTDPLDPDYLRSLSRRLQRVGGFRQIREEEPTSLLHALLLHGAQLELGGAALGLAADRPPSPGRRRPRTVVGPEPELVDVAAADGSAVTPSRAASRTITEISGSHTMADHIMTMPRPELARPTRQYARFRDSVTALAGTPVPELERLLRETLDCCAYRLDAWSTSLASRRLEALRSRRPAGIHVGGFGWVEDLHPGIAAPEESDGYVHVPSMAHAHTAAILRSGHLEHNKESEDGSAGVTSPLAVDLSSSRVRIALELLDGMRQGQSFGALLGYRFERALREADARLARYLLPLRRAAPLRTDLGDDGSPSDDIAIAARDVVDGVILLQRWRAERSGLLDAVGARDEHRRSLTEQLDGLEEVLDAVADVFVAESVFQAVSGNVERAGAAAGALDRQRLAVEPDVVHTPRTGAEHTYRLAVVLGSSDRPSAWRTVPVDARASAEPRLDAWIARVLGDPSRIRLAAELVDEGGATIGLVQSVLTDVGLSPISIVMLAGAGGVAEASELEEHVAAHLADRADGQPFAQLRVLADRLDGWSASDLSLADLLALASSIRSLIGSAGALRSADLALAEDEPVDGVDLGELRTRASALLDGADVAIAMLDGLGEDPTAEAVAGALAAAANVGIRGAGPGAVARALEEGDAGGTSGEAIADVAARLKAARARADEVGSTEGDRSAALVAAMRSLLGQDFPVLPLSTLAQPAHAAASLADRTGLLDGDELAPTTWLVRRGLVRPAVARLAEVLSWSELCGSGVGSAQLAVMQLPHRPGDRWVAADLPPDRRLPIGRVSVVAHAVEAIDLARPWSGLLVDDWGEQIPAPVETTGLALQYDAPGSRAPQAVLLAVPGDPDNPPWTLDALSSTVREALDLARIRAVDPQRLWLAGRMLPALYVAHNIVGDTAAINLSRLQERFGN